MNIINQPWLPFRFRNGEIKTLPISAISHPDIIDFSLNRADFQGAAYQFAIGLLQTVFAPEDEDEWETYFETPPSDNTLKSAFDKVAHAFNVTGNTPLFMQDFSSLEEQKNIPIAQLLIDAPGENGVKQNTDHFIKRGIADVMSLEMAVLALFTLQINAPSGGKGHLVSLRGGGPLTTLISPTDTQSTLWQKLWLNIINRDFWEYSEPNFYDGSVFPWLVPLNLKEGKGENVFPKDVHPLYMYWAMPRRIRLQIENKSAICQISGKNSNITVQYYLTKNYGLDYQEGWLHPLTPYTWDTKKVDSFPNPIKGKQGGIHYNLWDRLLLSSSENGQKCASVVSHYLKLCQLLVLTKKPRLLIFGYDMDNMKPRGWYALEMPIFNIDEKYHNKIINEIKLIQTLTSECLKSVKNKIKAAWFSSPKDISGDMSFIDLTFWQRSESLFFETVQNIIEKTQGNDYLTAEQASKWLNGIRNICLSIFDEYALSSLETLGAISGCIKARQSLIKDIYGNKAIKKFIVDFKITKMSGEENGTLSIK
ncbi:type I-E CRISPR-associated protein Cse1/CasA [Proteus columbae]|uniref:type I-E CRISPR-associated protein Cse1/CasA n=1 Tax=Proteus columbae TaxID=1987580 RepID=UPI000C1DF0AC|nr:type I-E CRISPR-associated protein Cse1/CasA [Proteus columbae]